MAKVLHIQSSPRGQESFSIRLAEAFLDAYRRKNPGDDVETLDLFTAGLPEFAAPAAKAKYAVMSGQDPKDEAGKAWKNVIAYVDQLKSADKILVSSPMWNFGIPYKLKHYFDIIVQPGLTFGYSPEKGYEGLLTGQSAAVILARGGAYGPGSGNEAYDMQQPYLEGILKFMGIANVQVAVVEPTVMGGPEQAEKVMKEAATTVTKLAERF